jgi:methylenetetrahydrofolate reductase (NADPH)
VTAAGCDVPIIAGLMPVTNMNTIARSAQLSGAPFPAALAEKFEAVADDPKSVRALGIDQATQLSQRLLDEGAPGLHFITFNFSKATREVLAGLALPQRA